MDKILITGSAGFIGFHLANYFLNKNYVVVGLDNLNSSYPKFHKQKRLALLKKNKNFTFLNIELSKINQIKQKNFTLIIHLAAEAGVRNSLKNPIKFVNQNINNTIRVFEFAKENNIKKIFYASSSSIYGENNRYPSLESHGFNKPLSIYGLTKTTNELTAYYYQSVFNISSIGFRFFTVYGPYGRPDMSINIFFNSIIKNKTIKLAHYGNIKRDYTYVDDIVKYIYNCHLKTKKIKKFQKVFNIGGQSNIYLKDLIKLIEKITNRKAKIVGEIRNKLDPLNSLANNNKIKKFTNKNYYTSLEIGLKKTYKYFKEY